MNAKKLLINAISVLVSTKPFSQITVQDILNEAEISRGTFYKYYKDKYELANAYYESYVTHNILSKYTGDNWLELVCEILSFVKKNHTYFTEISTQNGVNSFMDFLTVYSYQFFSSVYKYNTKKEVLDRIDEYRLWFVTGSNIMAFEKWMKNSCDIDPYILGQEMVSMMPEIFYKHIH